jgi:hypothetical protein
MLLLKKLFSAECDCELQGGYSFVTFKPKDLKNCIAFEWKF